MAGLSTIAGGASTLTGGWLVLLAVDLIAVLDASRTVRAVAAVALVLVVGGTLFWRFESVVARSVDAAMSRPLRSTAYGVAAHAVVAFSGVLLASTFSQLPISGSAALGPLLGLVVLLLAGGWGFTVIGASILERGGRSSRWAGLLVGAIIAGALAVVDPAVAGVGWLLVVSLGIGESVRTWFHASPSTDG